MNSPSIFIARLEEDIIWFVVYDVFREENNLLSKARKFLLYSFIGIALMITCQLFVVPVSNDAGGCAGGFEKYIAEKYAYDLGILFVENNALNEIRSYNYNNYTPQIDELVENMSWEKRSIYTSATMEFDGVNYNVKYKGTRYWTETYHWDITSITKKH